MSVHIDALPKGAMDTIFSFLPLLPDVLPRMRHHKPTGRKQSLVQHEITDFTSVAAGDDDGLHRSVGGALVHVFEEGLKKISNTIGKS